MKHHHYAPSLHALIRLIDQHRPAPSATILLSANDASDNAASTTSWELLRAGIAHLADGGINGQMGALTTAVTRASLRSAPLASALGVPAPVFKQIAVVSPCHDAHAEAVFFARRMTEAVLSDIDTSVPMIERVLAADKNIDSTTRSYFNQLASLHQRQCETLMLLIDRLPPPPKPAQAKGFSF